MVNRSQIWISQHLMLKSEANRKLLLILLFGLVLLTGVFSKQIQHELDILFFSLFKKTGQGNMLAHSQQTISTKITKGNWLSMVSYGLTYVFLCFATLHFYFNNAAKTVTTLGIYLVLLGLCGALVLTGIVLGGVGWPLGLSRRLIEIIVSPLPVIFLMAALNGPRIKNKHPELPSL